MGARLHTVGVECHSDAAGYGWAYNTVHLRLLASNRYNLRLNAAGANGWVNENTFQKGHFATYSDTYASIGSPTTFGPVAIWLTGGNHPINSNVFYQPCFETITSQWTEGTASIVRFDHCANDNEWHMCRHENDYVKGVIFFDIGAPLVTNNKATLAYSQGNYRLLPIVETTSGYELKYGLVRYRYGHGESQQSNFVVPSNRDRDTTAAGNCHWTSGPLGQKAKRCNSAGSVMIPGMYWKSGTGRSPKSIATTHIAPSHGRYFSLHGAGEGVGVILDTSVNKCFAVKVNHAEGSTAHGRCAIVGLNSALDTVYSRYGAVILPSQISYSSGVVTAVAGPSYAGLGYDTTPGYRTYRDGGGTGLNLTVNMSGSAPNMTVVSITVNSSGSGYKEYNAGTEEGTRIVLDPPSGGQDVFIDTGLYTSGYGGSMQCQPSDAWRFVTVSARVKFAEVLFWATNGSNYANTHSFEIVSCDEHPIRVSNYYTAYPDDVTWALEKPQTSWLTNGGCWKPGTFVSNFDETVLTQGVNRPEGWLYTGNNKFVQVPTFYVGTTQPTDTDLVWIDTTGL